MNHPQVQNALELSRIERDAAEDQYYQLKQEHDEALWQIEDLEERVEELRGGDRRRTNRGEMPSDQDSELIPLDEEMASRNEYPPVEEIYEYVPSDGQPVGFQQDVDSQQVVGIEIEPSLTRGFDSEGKPGDDGVVVAIRPVNRYGEFVPLASPVTLSLIDPAQKGIRQRVGLWKFSSSQVARRLDAEVDAFVFRLGWQRSAPKNSELKLFARFQTDDGKRETTSDLSVVLDGQPQSRWTQLPDGGSRTEGGSGANAYPSNFSGTDEKIATDNNALVPAAQGELRDETDQQDQTHIARPEWTPYR